MKGKGKQFIPHGRKVMMAFPGGAGYGKPSQRDRVAVRCDLALGYVAAGAARAGHALPEAEIAAVMVAAQGGDGRNGQRLTKACRL